MPVQECITLDYLEFYCQRNQLMIGCRTQDSELWISPLGPEPSELSTQEVQEILKESSVFEVREVLQDEDWFEESLLLSRRELEQRLRTLMN